MFKNIDIKIEGGSHEAFIIARVKGNFKGLKISHEIIREFLTLRQGTIDINTSRIELEEYEFISGVKNDVIINNEFEIKVYNKNIKPSDYKPEYLRPLHADYIMYLKNEYKTGGGIYSGRITVIYTILGAILVNYIPEEVTGHIKQIQDLIDEDIRDNEVVQDIFPVINKEVKEQMINLILENKHNNISLGAKLEFKIRNPQALMGGDLFESFESYLSANLFAIPGIKAISFGDYSPYTTSIDVIDNYEINEEIKSIKNYNGGVNAGYTNGYEDVIFSVTMRPTPTTSKIQPIFKINNDTIELVNSTTKGRHDAFIANRAIIVIIAMTIITLFDMKGQYNGFTN